MSDRFASACPQPQPQDPFYKRVRETARAEGIPISGTFELTPRCNFDCKMCYVHLKPDEIPLHGREMSAREWLRIAEEAKQAGTVWLCVTGGEPLLHPEFPEIWEALSEMGFFLTLQTNGSLVQGSVAKLLERCPPRQVKITLYGSNDAVYRAVCGVEQGFTQVNEGIRTLMEMGIPVRLVSTIIRQNLEDAQNMALYAYRHGLPWMATGSVRPSLRGASADVEAVRVTERLDAQKRAEVEARMQTGDFLDPARKPAESCKDYRIGYWVLWNGMLRFCSFMDRPDIPVRDLPFADAWQQLLAYEEALEWPEKCESCAAARVCWRCAASIAAGSDAVGLESLQQCKWIRERFEG